MHHRPRPLLAAALASIALTGCAPVAPAPAPVAALPAIAGVSTTLVTRLGTDTIAVEQYTRSGSHLEGVLATRMPFAMVARYKVQLDADNAPVSAEYGVVRGDGSPVPRSVQPIAVRYGRDSATIVGHRVSGDTTRVIPAPGMVLPYLNESYGLFELALARLLATGRDSATFRMLRLSFDASGSAPLPVQLRSSDSVRIGWFGDPMTATHDGSGHLISVDGTRTTDKVRVERVAFADVPAIARRWSAQQAAGGATGMASSRDTVRATIGTAHVWVDYGRPSLRGRDVWAQGVLGDTLWRTGANAATQLGTDADLMIGGQRVPAGTYSLFTWAGSNGYHLIVNRQAGQWGTDYDPSRDLARIPLRDDSAADALERFTILLERQGTTASNLVLAWGRKRLSVPVTTP